MTRYRPFTVAILMSLTACTTAPPAPLDLDATASSVEGRGRALAEMETAIRLVALDGSGIPMPDSSRFDEARYDDDFWSACALAYSRPVRVSRRRVLALREEARSAGAPGPIAAGYRSLDLGDLDLEHNLRATADLLGILGVGPAAAAEELAVSQARRALAELERSAWSALFDVARARARLAAARARLARIDELLDAAKTDLRRVDRLRERGRIGPGPAGRARAVVAGLATRRSRLVVAIAESRAGLAVSAGLPENHDGMKQVDSEFLRNRSSAETPSPAPSPRELLVRHPELRSLGLGYAVSEARLRRRVADQWPGIRLGSLMKFRPDSFLPGGIVEFSIPFPGSQDGRIEAALQGREAAREAIEDVLVKARASLNARHLALLAAIGTLEDEAPTQESQSAAAWRGARALFAIRESELDTWVDALNLRSRGILALTEARANEIVARLDFREAAALIPWREESK